MRRKRTADYGEAFRALKKGRLCHFCGKDRAAIKGRAGQLEFAHVKRTKLRGKGRGLRQRYLDVIRNPDCYVLAHRRCHRYYDMRAENAEVST